MHLILWAAAKGYETAIGRELIRGAAIHGDTVEIRSVDHFTKPEGDAGIIFGIVRREILWEHQRTGHPMLYLDKGFIRERTNWEGNSLPKWWRVCWNDVHPTAYMMKATYPSYRWEKTGNGLPKLRRPSTNGHILILGSSQKFHHTMHLPDPTAWAQDLQQQIAAISTRPIVYRPKPSWKAAVPIEGAAFDWGGKSSVYDALNGAYCSVTYGSIACVESILAGVPCIVLGNAVAQPVSGSSLSLLGAGCPVWPEPDLLHKWLAALGYHQWTPAELRDGGAWSMIKEQMQYAVG